MKVDIKWLNPLGKEYSDFLLFSLIDDKGEVIKSVVKKHKEGSKLVLSGIWEVLSEYLSTYSKKDLLDSLHKSTNIDIYIENEKYTL